jgi:dTDP-glucose 4,6-dehydratase
MVRVSNVQWGIRTAAVNSTGQSSNNVLVTGGAGFIGSCFCRSWYDHQSSPIVVLDKLTYAGHLSSLSDLATRADFHFERGDVADIDFVSDLMARYQPSAILHLAAESHVDRSITGPEPFLQSNVVGTVRLLEATRAYWSKLQGPAQEAFRFVSISTDEVFGSLAATGKFDESSPYAPNSPYAASKAAADHFVRAYYHTYGLPTITTNSSNNYGPFQFPEKLIPTMILKAMRSEKLPVYGDGKNVRDWIHVEDHCSALRAVIEKGVPGATYNIGANCERSNLEVVTSICQIVDELSENTKAPSTDLIEFVKDRPGHDQRYAIDNSKAIRELDWSPVHSFESGLAATVQWYAENSEWIQQVLTDRRSLPRLGVL